MGSVMQTDQPLKDYPPKASLLADIYQPLPVVSVYPNTTAGTSAAVCTSVLGDFASALETGNSEKLRSLFFSGQTYFRDTVAFTYHMRTLKDANVVSAALVRLNKDRRASHFEIIPESAQYLSATDTLGWVDFFFTFKTARPRASCQGKMMLLPEYDENYQVSWKIWTLSTWITGLEDFPEDETLLRAPSEIAKEVQGELETDVLIIGGGNSGLILAARLKALGVSYMIVDQNTSIGDNWALRYDFLRFHVPKSFCETPYLPYPKEANNELSKDELGEQMKRFAATFDLRVLLRTTVAATKFDDATKTWKLRLSCPDGKRMVSSKHLVLATGSGSGVPHVPALKNPELFGGVNVHSAMYKNPKSLIDKGVKSVLVIGSANTGFDMIEDCCNAGLQTVMVERSPTYLIPLEYMHAPSGLGIYEHVPAEIADAIVLAGPVAVGGQLLGIAHAKLSAAEPDRYAKLAEAGFQVLDSRQADLMHYLLERSGGHFVDMGKGVELLASKKVGIKAGVYPTSYTATGLKLSDGTILEADAIIWCTGFRDRDMRDVLAEILGEGAEDIRDKMEATCSLDAEGETRGLFKRHENMENLWALGIGAAHQRWYSKHIALQIKAAMEGMLPEAYRETPCN